MKSPCHDCELSKADKNERICMECEKRVNYVASLGVFPAEPETETEKAAGRSACGERRMRGMGQYKIGTCNNCERPDMALPSFGRCWVCFAAVRKAKKTGTSVEAALAEVKALVKSGVNLKSRARVKKKLQDQGPGKTEPELVTYKIGEARLVPGIDVVCLEFNNTNERDMKMFERVKQIAAEHRRNPDQEIMWILQHYIEAAGEEDVKGTS